MDNYMHCNYVHRVDTQITERERATLNVATAASGAFTGLGLKLRGLGVYGFRVWGAPKP